MLRAVASGEPELTQKVSDFHGRVGLLIGRALRGEGDGAEPSEEEQRIAHVLGQVWFASLVGWAGGLPPCQLRLVRRRGASGSR